MLRVIFSRRKPIDYMSFLPYTFLSLFEEEILISLLPLHGFPLAFNCTKAFRLSGTLTYFVSSPPPLGRCSFPPRIFLFFSRDGNRFFLTPFVSPLPPPPLASQDAQPIPLPVTQSSEQMIFLTFPFFPPQTKDHTIISSLL